MNKLNLHTMANNANQTVTTDAPHHIQNALPTPFNLGLAQLNFHVGHIEHNLQLILTAMTNHKNQGADIVVFSELAISGYSPEDLLLRYDFLAQVKDALSVIVAKTAELNLAVLIGYPAYDLQPIEDESDAVSQLATPPHSHGPILRNCAAFIENGEIKTTYFKQALPNYGVFDEKRYFMPGQSPCIVEFRGHQLGILICEDMWYSPCVEKTVEAGATLLLSLHGSPYHLHKPQQRQEIMQAHAARFGIPIVYVNQVGGQDDLIFDGHSFTVDAKGKIAHTLSAFNEDHVIIEWSALLGTGIINDHEPHLPYHSQIKQPITEADMAEVYQALVLATRDYVKKNGFQGITLGLSGGIDSALTLAVAVDALGAEACQAVMMPFKYTAEISIEDAREEANLLGVEFEILSIEPMFNAFMGTLNPLFIDLPKDTTEENLQARCRGVILMAISNKRRRLVLTTSNKSEVAVGYSTLYGDMAGGFNVLKDVPKTWVYALSRYRNTLGYVIPDRVITRAPSAELAPDQTDQDSLPPYDVLDPLLQAYVEDDASVEDLQRMKFDQADINRVLRLVNLNQYKRAQSPIGPKVTERSFARERRYPVTNGFNPFLRPLTTQRVIK